MQLQYLDALKALGAGPSTKFIFPLEFTNLSPASPAGNGSDGMGAERTLGRVTRSACEKLSCL